jgi:hypothetical protein
MFNMSILLQKAVESIWEVLGDSENLEEMLVNVRKCTDEFALDVVRNHMETVDQGKAFRGRKTGIRKEEAT